jgi:putative phosphoesterase
MLVGIISDTHGLMRPEAITALHGSDLIIHAGDVGKTEVIDQLNAIAPTHAVRGNVDTQSWARTLPDTRVVEAGGLRLFVLHVRAELVVDPVIAGYAAVIFGHSHTPSIETRSGVLWLNPGSAGPRRFQAADHCRSHANIGAQDRAEDCRAGGVKAADYWADRRSVDRDGRRPRPDLGRHGSQNRIGDDNAQKERGKADSGD